MTSVPGPKTRVRKMPWVVLRTCRANTAATWWGRPTPMLSATNDSKKAGPARVVEDQGAGDLHLAHGQLPPVARGPVGVGERCGDGGHPPVEERFDVSQAEPVTDGLNGAFGVGKTQTAHELQRRLRVGHVADPELLGFATHKMLPEQAAAISKTCQSGELESSPLSDVQRRPTTAP